MVDCGQLLEIVREMPPRRNICGDGVHCHPRQQERHEVFSGTLRGRVGGRERDYRPGEQAVGPPGLPHAWGQFSWSPISWLPKAEITAGSNMLNFVRSIAHRLREGYWMANFVIGSDLYEALRGHLDARAEQVGFFLADWRPDERRFVLRDWRTISLEGFEHQSNFHVSLTDEVRGEVIKWAWDSGACLIEAHSHGRWGPAKFSSSDLWGFDKWVPHLWWRLRGRPYAALVMAGEMFDAVAWIDGPNAAEQVEFLDIEGVDTMLATRRTLREGVDRGKPGTDPDGAKQDD